MSLEEAIRENTIAVVGLTAVMQTMLNQPAAPAPTPTAPTKPAKPAAAAKPAATQQETAGAKPTLDEAYTVAVRCVNDVAKAHGRDRALQMLVDAGCPKNAQGGTSLPRLTDNPKPSVDLLIAVATEAKAILEPAT